MYRHTQTNKTKNSLEEKKREEGRGYTSISLTTRRDEKNYHRLTSEKKIFDSK